MADRDVGSLEELESSTDEGSEFLELESAVICPRLLDSSVSFAGGLLEGTGSDAEVDCSRSFGERVG